MKILIPLAVKILDKKAISEDENITLANIIQKIDVSVIGIFEIDTMWIFVDKCLKLLDKQIVSVSSKKPPAVLFLNKVISRFILLFYSKLFY